MANRSCPQKDWVYSPGCVRIFKKAVACSDILGAMFIFSVLMAVVYSAFVFVYLVITEKTDEWMLAPAILASLCYVTLFILYWLQCCSWFVLEK